MVSLTALWLPILVSSVVVFLASSVLHMVLKYHHKDYRKLPDEEALQTVMRETGVEVVCCHSDSLVLIPGILLTRSLL